MQNQIILAVVSGENFLATTTLLMNEDQLKDKFFQLPKPQTLQEEPVDVHSINIHDNHFSFTVDNGPTHEFEVESFGNNCCFKHSRHLIPDTQTIDFHSQDQTTFFQIYKNQNLFLSIQNKNDENTIKVWNIDYEQKKMNELGEISEDN